MAIACKCDLDNLLVLKKVHDRLSRLDVGLVTVTVSNEEGKNRLRLAFEWLLRAISQNRRSPALFSLVKLTSSDSSMALLGTNLADATDYQNPASPDVLTIPPPWEIPRSDTATPTAAMHMPSDHSRVPQSSDTHHVDLTQSPISSVQSRSMSDLPASNTEATRTSVLVSATTEDLPDLGSKSSVTAVSLQADVSGTEFCALNDSTEPTDDMPEDRPGVPGRIR